MAILSAIFSLLARKVGDLIQALFGWSITALFGKQSTTKQVALSATLALSVLWPLFVVGTVFPRAAAWALAFLPLERWVGPTVLRVAWVTLAITAPLLVGAISRWVAPSKNLKGSKLRTVLGGFPLTLGYAVAFVVTAITVPLIKLASLARRWSDEHVYVQPREGDFDAVLRAVTEAFERAGLTPSIEKVPWSMSLATRTIQFLARGVVRPMVAENPRRVIAAGVEAYLYPADLMLRGVPKVLARVRAELSHTELERHAFEVESHEAQKVQEQVQRMWDELDAREREDRPVGHFAARRVREIYDSLRKTDVTFDEWSMLERMVRRLERKVAGGPTLIDEGENSAAEERAPMSLTALPDAPAVALMQEVANDVKSLVRTEVELAREEATRTFAGAQRAAIGFAVALVTGCVAVFLFHFAAVLACGGSALVALLFAAGTVAAAGVAGALAWKALPRKPMEETRARVARDLRALKEHTV